MATCGDDAPQDDRGQKESGSDNGGVPPPPPPPHPPPPQHVPPLDHSMSGAGNKVFKSGPLFLSSKGIGWTSWKKRWFILTSTSLVFFRSDPSAVPQKGNEVNLTLGGIDLNNSGSVVVKEDKKLLTVLFPDGRDGRTFTLKAETLEELYEWKEALEEALSQAPSATLVMGQNGIFQNDLGGTVDGSLDQLKDKQVAKSMVVGRPILLALEEIDGTPSFLEKALQFVEEHGIKVEGILRQAADVEDVERRIREYEQGNIEFSSAEDPHVVGDCIKFILRELPSSPIPASCCKALLEACRTDRDVRVGAIRMAICETFPEPNRRLLQRILIMMQAIASHKAENRMSSSAVAACMAPLLLRPLLAGECELENDFDVGGDGSIQLMQAAAAANYAQAIVIHLLEEYEKIFGESAMSPDLYSNTEESGTESEDATDDDDDGSYEDDEHGDYTQDSELQSDNSDENAHSESPSGSSETETESADFSHHSRTDGDSIHDDKRVDEGLCSESRSPEAVVESEDKHKSSPSVSQKMIRDSSGSLSTENSSSSPVNNNQLQQNHRHALDPDTMNNQAESSQLETAVDQNMKTTTIASEGIHSMRRPAVWGRTPVINQAESSQLAMAVDQNMKTTTTIASEGIHSMRRPAVWGRTPAKKNLSMESVEFGIDNEVEIERLEDAKVFLQNRVAEEAKENTVLLNDLERQRKTLQEHRLTLERDVAKLQEKLQKERDLRKSLEAGLKIPRGPLPRANIDRKVKADLEDLAWTEAEVNKLKQKANDLVEELEKEQEKNQNSHHDLSKTSKQGEDNRGKAVNKEPDAKSISGLHFAKRSISRKESDRIQTENEGPQQSTSYSTRHSNQLLDSLNYSRSRHSGQPSSSPAPEPHVGRSLPPTSSRRSVSRTEVTSTTSTALTKLTSRLNFLKERRSQIANELQNLDKSQSSVQATQIPDKGKASEG